MRACAHIRFVGLLLLQTLPFPLPGAEKVLVLGDSQSEEYVFETPFSAPESSPMTANIRNWIEILSAERGNQISFGSYQGTPGSYSDYRNAGFAYNWGVPGFTTDDLVELINPPSFPITPDEILDYVSCPQVKDQLRQDVAWAVVFCGGNDVNNSYGDYYEGRVGDGVLDAIEGNLEATIRFIQQTNPAVKIVLVNVPDVGVSPKVKGSHPDPLKRATATATIAALNDRLAALAAAKGIALADFFWLTRQLDGAAPLVLNGTSFLKEGDPENRPFYLFARDGFHPSTCSQALIANMIIGAMNGFYGVHFTPLPNREILSDVLGLNPDQPFLDWLSAHGLTRGAHADDPDRDGASLLAEFFSGFEPQAPDASPWSGLSAVSHDGGLYCSFPADHSGGYALATAVWNTDLRSLWQVVPNEWIVTDPAGTHVAIPPSVGPRAFLRVEFRPAP